MLQEPPAGSTTRRPRSVKVWLSAGPGRPSCRCSSARSERAAQLRLHGDGLNLLRTVDVRTSDYPIDVVVGQWPAAETKSADVVLLVNRGERGKTYVMPDVIGLEGNGAADVLRSFGFRVAVVGSYPYPGMPDRHRAATEPARGLSGGSGEAISLEVSR